MSTSRWRLRPFTFLPPSKPALPADARGLDRLAVDDSGAGLGITAEVHAEPFAQRRVDPLPGPIQAPFPEIVVDRLPRRPLLGQEAPSAAGAQLIEDRVEERAQRVETGPTTAMLGHERLEQRPFRVREIRSIEALVRVQLPAYPLLLPA